MGVDLRLPNITGTTDREKLSQMQSYLFQLVEQLQWALQNIDTTNASVVTPVPKSLLPTGINTTSNPQATFNSIKSLIIKSADIVESFSDEISRKLDGLYVAQSDFGVYAEQTSQKIEANSKSTTQRFENIQVIIGDQGGEIEAVKGSLETIGQDISYTQKDIIAINSNIEALDGSIASVEGAVGSLDEDLQTSKQELQGSVVAAKEELTGSINSTKTELTGNINSVKTNLEGSINSTKEELSGSIDNAKSELTGMVEEVDEELQNTKTDVNGRIDDTNGSVAGLGKSLNDANSRIADVDQDLQETKENISENIQGVRDSVTGVNALLEDAKAQLQGSLDDIQVYVSELQQVILGVSAYLQSGLLYYTDAGIPVYGLEIGQSVKDEVSGEFIFNKYARFTSEKLSFYDSNGNEVAYISDNKLFIRIAEVTVAFKMGGLIALVMDNGDVVEKWIGG